VPLQVDDYGFIRRYECSLEKIDVKDDLVSLWFSRIDNVSGQFTNANRLNVTDKIGYELVMGGQSLIHFMRLNYGK
jgi:hypothetical protein